MFIEEMSTDSIYIVNVEQPDESTYILFVFHVHNYKFWRGGRNDEIYR